MKIYASSAQIQGARDEQEDAFFIQPSEGPWVAAIADGMGGLHCGRQAAHTAIESVRYFFDSFTSGDKNNKNNKNIGADYFLQEKILSALMLANRRVWELGVREKRPGYVGTTLALAVLDGFKIYWASVGDSRVYLYRDGVLEQQSDDHNVWRRLKKAVSAGFISPEDAQSNPEKEALTSYIGIDELTEIGSASFELLPDDALLLLTDGVFKSISEERIAATLEGAQKDPAQAIMDAVISARNRHQDNATAVLLCALGCK